MQKKPFYRIREAAELVGVSDVTLRKYVREGRVECSRNPGNHRIFTLNQLAVLNPALKEEPNKASRVAHYTRSSDGSKDLLESQKELLETQYGEPDYLISDKASGLKEDRKGLKRLIKLAENRQVDVVIVTEKDRLTRFGFSYLEALFNAHDVEIKVLGTTKTKSPHDELIADFLSLLASFSGKYYRLRGHQQKKDFLNLTEDEVNRGPSS